MGILSDYETQKKLVYLMIFIVVTIPILKPIGLPVFINDYTKDFYYTIENQPADSVVMVHYGFSAGAWGELESQCVAVAHHLMSRPLKVVFFSTWDMGPVFITETLNEIDLENKVYGRDYVVLGYIPGYEVAIAAMANDFHGVVNVDYYGNSIEGTFLDDVNDASDVPLVIAYECGAAAAGSFVQQFHLPYGSKVLAGSIGVMVTGEIPNYNAGLISGILASVRGGAEYELLVNKPAKGLKGTDVLTFAHVMVIIAMVIGNIIYFRERSNEARVYVEEVKK